MTRAEKIEFIKYRVSKRNPEYPVAHFDRLSEQSIDAIYLVESKQEEQEIEEQAAEAM
mgnify:CR=1 FL=1